MDNIALTTCLWRKTVDNEEFEMMDSFVNLFSDVEEAKKEMKENVNGFVEGCTASKKAKADTHFGKTYGYSIVLEPKELKYVIVSTISYIKLTV